MQGTCVMSADGTGQLVNLQLAATANLPKKSSKGFCVLCNKQHTAVAWYSAAVRATNDDPEATAQLLAGGRPVVSGICPALTECLNSMLEDVMAKQQDLLVDAVYLQHPRHRTGICTQAYQVNNSCKCKNNCCLQCQCTTE